MAKKQNESIVTPQGTAIYPHLIEPDTKFNALGEYKVSLAIDEDEAAPIITKIDEQIAVSKKLIPKGKKEKMADEPYFPELDDEGQETGRVVFKFKMKAQINTKDGRTITMSPKLFDAEGSLAEGIDSIWGGSELRVSADLIPFYVAAVGAGVSLRMKAVQIIDLVQGGGASASNYGFDATEGYVAPKEEKFEEKEVAHVDEEEDF
jgi:hypothetical protein